jgi:putative nucleotidyltransferase with HDIG domain
MKAIEAAALLHDLGKLRVPEHILNKPGRLTSAEFEKIKSHSSVGAEILSSIDFQYPVVPIVRHHHENWNGSGYPDGLAGTEIPIGARILAVVDCFDALTSDRPYRPGLSDEEATRILIERRGTMYDPVIVDCFLRVHGRLRAEGSERELQAAASSLDHACVVPPVTEPMLIETISARDPFVKEADTGSLKFAIGDAFAADLLRTIPASLCAIYLYQEATDDLVAVYASGMNAQLLAGLRIQLAHSVSGWVAANLQTIVNSDPSLDLRGVSRLISPALRSCLSTPLLAGDKLVGVLTLYSTARQAFTDEDGRSVESSTRRLAELLNETLANDSAPNKSKAIGPPPASDWGFSTGTLSGVSATASGAPHSAAVLLVELRDGLAADSEESETRLQLTVSLLHRAIRSSDILLRYGPNQLLVILPQTDVTTAHAIAARIGCNLGVSPHGSIDGDTLATGARVGLALVPQDGVLLDRLVLAARNRLESGEAAPNDGLSGHVH